jgi:hypothetical protein
VLGNDVALRTKCEVRSFVALFEHSRLVRAVRLVAVEASAFLGRIFDRRGMFEGKRSLKLVVTREADLARPSKFELPVGLVERHMTLRTFHDPVKHRVPERSGKFSLDLRMAIDAEAGFGFFEKIHLFVRVDLVAPAAVDVVLRVDVPFLHVLLMRVRVTPRTHLSGNHRGHGGGVGGTVVVGIFHVLLRPRMTPGAPNPRIRGVPLDLVHRAREGLPRVVVAVQTLVRESRIILGRETVEREDRENTNPDGYGHRDRQEPIDLQNWTSFTTVSCDMVAQSLTKITNLVNC